VLFFCHRPAPLNLQYQQVMLGIGRARAGQADTHFPELELAARKSTPQAIIGLVATVLENTCLADVALSSLCSIQVLAENKETKMADRVGFEPTVGFHLRRFSRPLP
jgi:hypothetical protein